MLDVRELESRILAVARKTFGDEVILSVHCERDVDHVSEPVVWVRFVVSDNEMPLKIDRMVKLDFGVELSQCFRDWEDQAYPVTFFYPESEYRSVFSAAA